MKKLGGSLFVYNAISQDYCLREAVASLQALCDEVVVLDCGSTDGTERVVFEFADAKTTLVCLDQSEWHKYSGREKLSHFTNVAASFLTSEWHFNLQADEVIHEASFPAIRQAIEQGGEAYFCSRINLWGSSQYQLDVLQERKPVSTEVIRLAKKGYQSIDDAESILAPAEWGYVDQIRIYHMGFVRDKYRHCAKVKHMQEEIFGFAEMDKKVQDMNGVFNPWMHFQKEDLIPIKEPLPVFVQQWAQDRDTINGFM